MDLEVVRTRSKKAIYILSKLRQDRIIYPKEICSILQIKRRLLQEIIYEDIRYVLEECFEDYAIEYVPSEDIYRYKN